MAAVFEVHGLGAQARDLPLLRLQLGARGLLFGEQAAMFDDADLLNPRQRHHAAAGPRQVALVGRVEQQPHVAVAAALVERLQPFFERRRSVDALVFEGLARGPSRPRPWR